MLLAVFLVTQDIPIAGSTHSMLLLMLDIVVKLRRLIKCQYKAEPIIKVNPAHKKALFPESEEWKGIYNRRTSIERIFARLKGYRRLNNITVRRNRKVTVHSFIPLIVTQAMAMAFSDTPRNCT